MNPFNVGVDNMIWDEQEMVDLFNGSVMRSKAKRQAVEFKALVERATKELLRVKVEGFSEALKTLKLLKTKVFKANNWKHKL